LPTSSGADSQVQSLEREIALAKKQIADYESDLQRTGNEVNRECDNLRDRLAKAKAVQEKRRREYIFAKRRYDDKIQRLRRYESDTFAKKELQASIELIESSLSGHKKLEGELTQWRQNTKAYEVEIGSMEEEIKTLKDEITTSVQLAEKYGGA
jgi:chromosome segregation ATPase